MRSVVSLFTFGLLSLVSNAAAESSISGGITITALAAEGGRASPTGAGSFDLVSDKPAGNGAWVVYIEGSTAKNGRTVPDIYPTANGDADTAQLNNSNGTVQISELKYRWDGAPGGALTVGVVDPTNYVDTSGTANDENSQFLNTELINNGAITFPSYTPGIVYQGDNLFLLVAGSHGLADNPKKSYGELFQLNKEGKGVFSVAAVRFRSGTWSTELGAWTNTADHTSLDGLYTNRRNYGYYGVLGAGWGNSGFDLRAGYSNPEVTEGNRFASASSALELGDSIIAGLGYAYHELSVKARADGRGDSSVAEFYIRFAGARWETTLDLQRLRNPNFDATAPATYVGGIRLHRPF